MDIYGNGAFINDKAKIDIEQTEHFNVNIYRSLSMLEQRKPIDVRRIGALPYL